MSYQVLARKWRPRNFAEMVGQEHVVRALSNALDNDRLHHAYLFTGTRGVGKTTLARILSKALNCESGVSATPCGACSVCREIDEGRFVDLLEVDAASKTGVDDTRELLDNVPYAPVRGRFKVYLIDEVHMFSGHSFNALLKTLEEPPPHVKFLLATTDPQKVPVTVLSRCLQFNLKRLPLEQIEAQFRHILAAEEVAFEADALAILARAADGSMRDGLSLLDQAIAFGGGSINGDEVRAMLGVVATDRLPGLVDAVQRGDAAGVMTEIGAMAEYAPDFGGLLRELVTLLHRIAVLQQAPEAGQSAWASLAQLQELSRAIPLEDVQLFYQIALVGQRDLPLAPDERSGFEMLLLRMLAFRPQTTGEAGTPTGRMTAPPAAAVGTSSAPPGEPAGPATGSAGPESTPVSTGSTADAAPVSAAPALDDWHAVLGRLALRGMAAQLASHSVVDNWDGTRLALRVDPSCSSLIGSLAEEKLAAALAAYLDCSLKLHLISGKGQEETPAQRAAREKQALQAATEAEISRDPLVLAAQEAFDAEIIPDSIRRLD